ncbi:lactonase family protein [Halostagnicola sp. A-GB9-2]|uniref:lactonase family protein n=1 Tax=Halostagnicola sp. A-GB9-2 TaxID=3048066 RepID=UPI0024BFBB88|nr:lactonase family protein [Halostagnicola sp. A-GB9-2]MDJ1433641.1 lactonase family protein [Halostagnicola sp. A-GB9-2]
MTSQRSFLVVVCSAAGESDGAVHGYRFDPDADRFRRQASTPLENPSFVAVHPDRRSLYAVERVDGGVLAAFEFDDRTGALGALNRKPSRGTGPCYVDVDPDGRVVTLANYQGGTVAAYPIEADGRLSDTCTVLEHEGSSVDSNRQREPHPHAARFGPENRFVYVPDLGTDCIESYRCASSDVISGTGCDEPPILEATANGVSIHEGAGPRHLDFHPDGRFAYVVNELDSTVTVLERQSTTGELEPVHSVSTLPPAFDDDNTAADIHVHPTGRWVYATNRGHDSIAVFETDSSGNLLRPMDHVSARGRTPRTFTLAPNGEYLFVANQHGENVVAYRIDADSGSLSAVASVTVQKPVCVEALKLR